MIAINGLGRIGKLVLTMCLQRGIPVFAVNIPNNIESVVHLLNFDSVHGKSFLNFKAEGNYLTESSLNKKIKIISEKNFDSIKWKDLGVKIVVESSGKNTEKEKCVKALENGAELVLITAPSKNADATFVHGINHKKFNKEKHKVISAASCTTTCLLPIVKILNDEIGIKKGFMTTIHAFTGDQRLLDGSHKDLRRARAATLSIIPTSTGAAKSIELVLPELKGKLDGIALRVPTPNVSLIDLTVELNRDTSVKEINDLFLRKAEEDQFNLIDFCDLPLVSADLNGCTSAAVIDSLSTMVNKNSVKILAWYDNEVAYSSKLVDLIEFILSEKNV
ncbi:MAG TPA: type I glyceraldehyde-3-phosphate dehydrogenase [archaeon]|nr:type I glyceraldehyde-3-phosphate dehydrogenase [archaeon]